MNITYVAWPVLSVHFLQQSVLTKVTMEATARKNERQSGSGWKKEGSWAGYSSRDQTQASLLNLLRRCYRAVLLVRYFKPTKRQEQASLPKGKHLPKVRRKP